VTFELQKLGRLTPAAFEMRVVNIGVHIISSSSTTSLSPSPSSVSLSPSLRLTADQLYVLGLGIKFIPFPRRFRESRMNMNLDFLKRRFRLKHFFLNKYAGERPEHMSPYYVPSTWNPDDEDEYNRSPWPSYFEAVRSQVLTQLATLKSRTFQPPCIRSALRELRVMAGLLPLNPADPLGQCRSDIVVQNADKNLGLVVMDVRAYDAEVRRQLADHRFYEQCEETIENSPDRIHHKLVTFVDTYRFELLQQQHGDTLVKWLREPPTSELTHPEFKVIPKVHKQPWAGRPIVPSHSSALARASRHLSILLMPVAVTLTRENGFTHVLRDSTELLLELDKLVLPRIKEAAPGEDDGVWLFTGDVSALYTNIPHNRCLATVRQLSTIRKPALPHYVYELTKLLFDNAYFKYQNLLFRQKEGFPMGTSCAPLLANYFLHHIEKELKDTLPQDRSNYPLRVYRFIDDIFGIWIGKKATLEHWLNVEWCRIYSPLKVTWSISAHVVEYLDLHISKGARYRASAILDTATHQKLLNRYLYIPQMSFHPQHVYAAWIRAELLRYLRNSSTEDGFYKIRDLFISRLLSRGYRPKFIASIFSKVSYTDRPQLLHVAQARLTYWRDPDNHGNGPAPPPIVLRVTDAPNTHARHFGSALTPALKPTPNAGGEVVKYHADKPTATQRDLESVFHEGRPRIARARAPNLANLLIRSRVPALPPELLM